MDYKIGEMLTVGGKFGDVIGEQNGLPIVFLLREKESIIADPAKHNVQRLGGSKKVASKKMALEGDPPKGADDTALKLWSMGYRGKALEDQMAALGFTEAQTRKAVEMAQTEYRARREDGGGRWEILEPGERVKLASGEWGKVVKVGDPMQVRFADGKVEPVQMSDLDDLFVSGRLVIARIDRLIAGVEEELGLEGDFTVQYTIPGANPDKKKFNSDRDAADFVEDLLKQHGPNVQIMLPVKQTLRTATEPAEEIEIAYQVPGDPFKRKKFRSEKEVQKFIEKLKDKYGEEIKLDIRRQAAEPAEQLAPNPEQELPEVWEMPTPLQKPIVRNTPEEIKEMLRQQQDTIKPLEYNLTKSMEELRDLFMRFEDGEKALEELKAKAKQIYMQPDIEQKKLEKEYRDKFEQLMGQIRSLEGKTEHGKSIMRKWENMLIMIKTQVERGREKPLTSKVEEAFDIFLQTIANDLDTTTFNYIYDTVQTIMDLTEEAEPYLALRPKVYPIPAVIPGKESSKKVALDWKQITDWLRGMWERIRDLGRQMGEADEATARGQANADAVEMAMDEMLTRTSARLSFGGK